MGRDFEAFPFSEQSAVKSIKPIVKNLVEMDKELDIIAQVSSTGDLRGKLAEAEEAKVEVEAILLKRVSSCTIDRAVMNIQGRRAVTSGNRISFHTNVYPLTRLLTRVSFFL